MSIEMEDGGVKPRINVGMFGQFKGKYVTVVGQAYEPEQNGMGFRLKSSDNHDIMVKLQEPLQDYVNGVVQVQGMCDGKNMVNSTYVPFTEGKKPFDLEQYNTAIGYMARFEELIPKVPESMG